MNRNDAFALVVEEIKRLLDNNMDVYMDTNVQHIGLDSINFIKLLIYIEGEFHIEFNDDLLLIEKYTTVADFVDVICENIE